MRLHRNSNPTTVRVGTWNTAWAGPRGPRGGLVKAALAAPGCDVLCVTEGYPAIFPDQENVLTAPQNWGYRAVGDRRKVTLWSKRRWTSVNRIGSESLPGGRFVKGVTRTPAGCRLTVVGVCIPWAGAHSRSGRMDRKRWEDHTIWLEEFQKLRSELPNSRTVVLGDFNQRIPRRWAPKRVYEALLRAFDGFEIATKGELQGAPRPSIDHIPHTSDLEPGSIKIWRDRSGDGRYLSDHFGVWCDLRLP